MKKLLFFHLVLSAILMCAIASPLLADTAIVPTDYATVQGAVNAVQGTPDPTVIIESNAIFDETVTITESVTIEPGTGYSPTLRGVISRTIYFNPNSISTQNFTIRGLTLLPRTGIGPCSGYNIIDILNAGSGETTILIEGLTLNDPENGGPDGINIRSSGGPNNVTVQNTAINLGGGPGCGVNAFFMGELGTLTVSDVTVNMSLGDGSGFDIRGSGITFILEDSTFNISAPLGSFSAEVGRLLDLVNLTIRGNTFNLTSNAQGSAQGISAGSGSQNVTMDSNYFNGSGPNVDYAFNASPPENDTGNIIATNNVIFNMGGGFVFSPRSGIPGGVVNAILTNNTIDGCEYDAVSFSANDNTTVNAVITNNLLTNNGRYGFEAFVGAGATLNVNNSYNDFFNNTSGATDGTVIIGPNSLYVDPVYVNPKNGDFHLQPGSPCIDKGDNNAPLLPSVDFEGDQRIFDGDNDGIATVDMGCDEYSPITVTAPNGGEIIPSGSTYPIQWEAPQDAVNFTLKYSMDNGKTWKPLASEMADTSYDWAVPTPPKNKTKCLVKVIGYNASGKKVAAGSSDAPFTIEVLTVTSPNGGEICTSGDPYTITWTTNGTKKPVEKVVLKYTKNGGKKWKKIEALTENTGTYEWTVPDVPKTKSKCLVKVVLKDAKGNTVGSDTSDSSFTIEPAAP